jgi:large subunit ribosomal protein L6
MSRIGKLPVNIPSEVEVTLNGNLLRVKGKNGELSRLFPVEVNLAQKDNAVVVSPKDESRRARAMWGMSRSLVNNMVTGVSTGFTLRLEINGVGYRAAADNKFLTLTLGYSHDIFYEIPEGISIKCEKPTLLVISGADNQKVGQIAAEIRALRKPEPYKGKGIKYEGEFIKRKEGKKK